MNKKVLNADERFKNVSRIMIFLTATLLGGWLVVQAAAYLPYSSKYALVPIIIYPVMVLATVILGYVKGRKEKQKLNTIALFSIWPGISVLIAAGVFYLMLVVLEWPEWTIDLLLLLPLALYILFRYLHRTQVKPMHMTSPQHLLNRFLITWAGAAWIILLPLALLWLIWTQMILTAAPHLNNQITLLVAFITTAIATYLTRRWALNYHPDEPTQNDVVLAQWFLIFLAGAHTLLWEISALTSILVSPWYSLVYWKYWLIAIAMALTGTMIHWYRFHFGHNQLANDQAAEEV